MMSISSNRLGKMSAKALFTLAAFGFGALSAAVVGTSPEALVASRFTTALSDGATSTQGGGLQQVAGSEDFWLKGGGRVAAPLEPAAWSHAPGTPLAFAIGDTVTVTREGAGRAFKIVSVSAPFKDGAALSVRVVAQDTADQKAAPIVFTVPAPQKPEAGKPRAS